MSYTCKIIAATIDNTGQSANINATLQITLDSDGSVVQTRVVPTNGMTGDQLKAYAAQMVSALVVRDSFFPTIKAAADASFILAQG